MGSRPQRPCACGRQYDAERWAALSLFARLAVEEVSPIAIPWPPHLVVEVRVCANCKRRISRLIDGTQQAKVKEREGAAQ